MRTLLIGEYSHVHATLAEGLRALGHDVTVISNGDFWKDYPRDIDVSRRPGKWGGILLMARLYRLLPRMRDYDVVQLINPMFFELKAQRLYFFFDYTRVRTDEEALRYQREWLGTPKEQLNRYIAEHCDGIITGLYEYHVCYQPCFPDKTTFIPYPIRLPKKTKEVVVNTPLRLFIGVNRERSVYKGTDIMLRAAKDVESRHPQQLQLMIAESVPFAEYQKMMDGSDAILDQLYSYTPSMNALLAMSKGIICIGGGEPENYEIIHEHDLRPIINVTPTYESVCEALESLMNHPERIAELKRQSMAYVSKHHDYLKVAQQYLDAWHKK